MLSVKNHSSLFLSILGTAFLLTFCTSAQQKKITNLENEVLSIHDSTMVDMDKIEPLKKQLDQYKNDTMLAVQQRKELEIAKLQLTNARKDMMDWMHNYNTDFKGTDEEKISYLEAEKAKINEVHSKMKESIEKAQSLLGNK